MALFMYAFFYTFIAMYQVMIILKYQNILSQNTRSSSKIHRNYKRTDMKTCYTKVYVRNNMYCYIVINLGREAYFSIKIVSKFQVLIHLP